MFKHDSILNRCVRSCALRFWKTQHIPMFYGGFAHGYRANFSKFITAAIVLALLSEICY